MERRTFLHLDNDDEVDDDDDDDDERRRTSSARRLSTVFPDEEAKLDEGAFKPQRPSNDKEAVSEDRTSQHSVAEQLSGCQLSSPVIDNCIKAMGGNHPSMWNEITVSLQLHELSIVLTPFASIHRRTSADSQKLLKRRVDNNTR